MEKATDLKNSVRRMEIGEALELPIERLAVLRQYAYDIKLMSGLVYKVIADGERRVATITRVE